jgi:glutathione peroxidase
MENNKKENNMNIYDIKVNNMDNQEISLETYKNKVLLIVNTATGCGFTPQYVGLQELYEKYGSEGFEVLDFPCNQFGNQAPGDDAEINSFCTLNYGTTFPRFSKIEVNGSNESPLYKFLKKEKGGLLGSNIKWNFTKFLVDKNGEVVERYSPTDKPEKMEEAIVNLLK